MREHYPVQPVDRFVWFGRVICTLFCATTLAPIDASAVDISVANAGFEDDPVAMGCFAVFFPNGWDVHDPGGIIDQGLDVVGGIHPEGGPYFVTPAPEGDHAAIVFLGADIGGAPAGLRQQLADVLLPNQRYSLSVQIGDIASGIGPPPCDVFGFFDLDGFPGYQVQLLAGDVVIAEDDNSLAPLLTDGVFLESSIEVVIEHDHPQLGQPLEIRLINLNMIDTPEDPGIEVDFDDVRLSRECANDGDINNDGAIDATDVALFISVLLGTNTQSDSVNRSDLDCSGESDSRDLPTFVAFLLSA